MAVCLKCGKNFKIRVMIEDKLKNLQRRKYCLECSPFRKHNTKQIHVDKVVVEETRKISCNECSKVFIYSRKKGHTLKLCNSCSVNLRRKEIKPKMVEYKGGSCVVCGYKKCMRALQFHHLDPTKKDFEISGNHTLSWKKLKKELDKCMLVCSNCHMEIHESGKGNR